MKKNGTLPEENENRQITGNGFELIRIQTNENEEQVVSGRDLHNFLEVKTRYNDWINKRVKEYEFIENIDFIAMAQKRATAQGNETTYFNHIMKISMAKEVAIF